MICHKETAHDKSDPVSHLVRRSCRAVGPTAARHPPPPSVRAAGSRLSEIEILFLHNVVLRSPVFVPSLSWQHDRSCMTMAQSRPTFRTDPSGGTDVLRHPGLVARVSHRVSKQRENAAVVRETVREGAVVGAL